MSPAIQEYDGVVKAIEDAGIHDSPAVIRHHKLALASLNDWEVGAVLKQDKSKLVFVREAELREGIARILLKP